MHLFRVVSGLSCALALASGGCAQPAAAQSFEDFSDDVVLYVRDGQSDHPSIVLYDPEAVRANADAKHPVVELTLDLSGATESWDYRAAIDERFNELLKGAPARLAATHTEPKQGRRSYLLVSADAGRVTAAFESIKPPAGITAATRTLSPSELKVWEPTPLELQDALDERVRAELANQGDDGTKPRPVDFYFYGGDQVALRAAAKQDGFQARVAHGDRAGVILSRRTAVDSKSLTTLNGQFVSWSDRFGVEYDGWETEVLKK